MNLRVIRARLKVNGNLGVQNPLGYLPGSNTDTRENCCTQSVANRVIVWMANLTT
jgi:hypothetical protein